MAKKKKTREQKRLADLRHNFQHQIVNHTFEVKFPASKIDSKISPAISAPYPYLAKDLSKTFTLTALIVAAQIILFFILKNHLIMILGLAY